MGARGNGAGAGTGVSAGAGAGAGAGAAAGMLMAMKRKALIEHIDATLDKRPYEFKLAQGSTASGWPQDARQADGSLGAAMGGALKMERDILAKATAWFANNGDKTSTPSTR